MMLESGSQDPRNFLPPLELRRHRFDAVRPQETLVWPLLFSLFSFPLSALFLT